MAYIRGQHLVVDNYFHCGAQYTANGTHDEFFVSKWDTNLPPDPPGVLAPLITIRYTFATSLSTQNVTNLTVGADATLLFEGLWEPNSNQVEVMKKAIAQARARAERRRRPSLSCGGALGLVASRTEGRRFVHAPLLPPQHHPPSMLAARRSPLTSPPLRRNPRTAALPHNR